MFSLRNLTLATVLPAAAFAQQQDPQTAWKNFTAKHGTDWRVEWNPATNTPSAIFGPGLKLDGRVDSLDAARAEANRLFDTYSALLGRGDSRFVEIIGEKTNMVYTLVYDQEYKGLSVISGRADMRINEIGVVALFGSSAVRIPQGFNTVPALSSDAAATLAEELVLGAASKVADHAAPRLVVWADAEAKLPTTATLAWEVQIDERPAAVKVGKAYIDARSGALLQFKNEVYTCNMCTSVHVSGSGGKGRLEKALARRNDLAETVAPKAQPGMPKFAYVGRVLAYVNRGHNPLDPLTLTGLPYCLVTSSAGSAYTDVNGFFTIASTSTANVAVTATLTGRYTKRIRVAQGTQMSRTVTLAPNSSANIIFGTASSPIFDRSQMTTYYFTTDCHNWFRSLLPASTALTNLANMDPRVNIASTCNAYYTGYTINFYNAGGSCNHTAYETVIQHEWGHGADDAYGGISQTDGLSEGWGDILCILRSRQPLVGPNFYTSGASVRTALNTLTYPAGGGVHQQGQTWMGFCWDARTNLMATLGAATGEARCISIFIKSMPADATTQPNAVREVFIQDDDDGNLNNGTPNYADLEKAALKRKLPYPMKTGPGKAVYVPDADATTGGCNVIPFGTTKSSTTWVNQRYQTMVTKADLGNPTSNITICGLAFAPCGSGMKTFSSLQIILGQTTATSLGTNFASNRPSNARTVFFQRNYEWPLTANTWDPIGQEINYTYNPALGNLVVEVIAQGSDINASGFHTGARQRLYAYNWTTIPSTGTIGSSAALKMKLFVTEGGVATFGQGCVGSNSLTPTLTMAGTGAIGTSYTVSLSNALANAGAFLSVNVTGLWDPPLDLGIVGAAGCKMYFNNDFTLAVAANASGAYAIRLPIPTSTPLCERVYFQFFPRDARANRLGLTSTNYGRLLTGN